MAAKKSLNQQKMNFPVVRSTILTRARKSLHLGHIDDKRKAEASPAKNPVKRSAFGDLTNASKINSVNSVKISTKSNVINIDKQSKVKLQKSTAKSKSQNSDVGQGNLSKKPVLKQTVSSDTNEKIVNKGVPPLRKVLPRKSKGQTSTVCAKSEKKLSPVIDSPDSVEDSLYISALDITETTDSKTVQKHEKELPPGVDDFDKENMDDPTQISEYAMDIFSYMKNMETSFVVPDYMSLPLTVNPWMRALLIDWMVEVQENFELNHETLYLSVRLVDLHLSKNTVQKDKLQLVGATSLFISSKFEERCPPPIEDFLYVCDGAYNSKQLIDMEIKILRSVDFRLGIPLSYSFLRRYARCAKILMPTLTLARFILETSLLDYSFVSILDSKMAAACLFLALKMESISDWTPTLQYYSGYKVEDFKDTVLKLNEMLQKPPNDMVSTVRNKYSHEIFYQVAKFPVLKNIDFEESKC